MFGKLDNNTILLIVTVVLGFLYFTMDNKESYRSISAGKRGKISSRSAGKVSDKKVEADAVPIVEGYMNGYY